MPCERGDRRIMRPECVEDLKGRDIPNSNVLIASTLSEFGTIGGDRKGVQMDSGFQGFDDFATFAIL